MINYCKPNSHQKIHTTVGIHWFVLFVLFTSVTGNIYSRSLSTSRRFLPSKRYGGRSISQIQKQQSWVSSSRSTLQNISAVTTVSGNASRKRRVPSMSGLSSLFGSKSVSSTSSTTTMDSITPTTISSSRGGAIATLSSSSSQVWKPLSYYLRVALAGGMAGATGTAVLYPMDSAKTLRQSNPKLYSSVRHALMDLIKSKNDWHISRAYRGILPATLGAIPSSALYFGAYESSKITLQRVFGNDDNENTFQNRLVIHGLAAACGNVISSAVFVPKEVIKQQMQYAASSSTASSSGTTASVVMDIMKDKGIRGLYSGYQATLMRNIPSAILRFVLYEELKRVLFSRSTSNMQGEQQPQSRVGRVTIVTGGFVAGAIAGATASAMMTPIDVIKTRITTGTCPVDVRNCMLHVIKEAGWKGLYAGAGSRMVWSGAFSAIGFGTFEVVKGILGVSGINNNSDEKKVISSPSFFTPKTESEQQQERQQNQMRPNEMKLTR